MRLMTEPEAKPRTATPWQVAKAVFWSFLGIRRRAAHEHDAVTLKPVQVIVAGLIHAHLDEFFCAFSVPCDLFGE